MNTPEGKQQTPQGVGSTDLLAPDVRALVGDLIRLYNQTKALGPCERDCECSICVATRWCDEHQAATWERLEALVRPWMIPGANDKITDERSLH